LFQNGRALRLSLVRGNATIIAVKAEANRSEVAQRAHEKAGADQQNERQCNLDDHQRLTEPRAAATAERAAAALVDGKFY